MVINRKSFNKIPGTARCSLDDLPTDLTLEPVIIFLAETVRRYSNDPSEKEWATVLHSLILKHPSMAAGRFKNELSNVEFLITSLLNSAGQRLPARIAFDLLSLRGLIQIELSSRNMATESFMKALWLARSTPDIPVEWASATLRRLAKASGA